jgi:hypothetical protein
MMILSAEYAGVVWKEELYYTLANVLGRYDMFMKNA